jgi:hypothetical protein
MKTTKEKEEGQTHSERKVTWDGYCSAISVGPFRGASLADRNERRNSLLFELRARSHSELFCRLGGLLNIEWRAPQDRTPSNAQKIGARLEAAALIRK